MKILSLLLIYSVAISPAEANDYGFNCTFAEDLCGWTQATDDNFDWVRVNGQSRPSNSRPPRYYSNSSTDWYFLSANPANYKLEDKARLVSPTVNMTAGNKKCFQFFYLLHGNQIGSLSVYFSRNGTVTSPAVWSRVGTQGIFFQQGQVTLNDTTRVIIEGSGASGVQGDFDIDDFTLLDSPCSEEAPQGSVSSLACDFDLEDVCGYTGLRGDNFGWHRSLGAANETYGPTSDQSSMSAAGGFMIIAGSSTIKQDSLRSRAVSTPGVSCLTFFFTEFGTNVGLLSVSLFDVSRNNATGLWWDDGTALVGRWSKAQITLNITGASKLSFDATLLGGSGYISVHDVRVANGSCEPPPNCNFDRYDLCSWSNDFIHDHVDWEIATLESDVQILAPWRDADNNTSGGFIMLDMSYNPGNKEAYLVSNVISVQGAQCFSFYYYPLADYFEAFPEWVLNVYMTSGTDFPGTLVWSYSMQEEAPAFTLAQVPLWSQKAYQIVVGGLVTEGDTLALDKFSLQAYSCGYLPEQAEPPLQTTTSTAAPTSTRAWQPPPTLGPSTLWSCDFENTSCHWESLSDSTVSSVWFRANPKGYLNGPEYDHTKGPGKNGSFITMGGGKGQFRTDTQLNANTSYCLVIWLYLYGSLEFEFGVQTLSGNTTTSMFYKDDFLDTNWHQMMFSLPSAPTPFDIQFSYNQVMAGSNNQVAIDDISIFVGRCPLEAGPNCTFDRGLCGWTNMPASGLNMTQISSQDKDLWLIEADHTMEAELGGFISARADNHTEGQKAYFLSPGLTSVDAVCMQFYYYMSPGCDSRMGVETLGSQDRHPISLLDVEDVIYGTWQLLEVTVHDPFGVQVILTVTLGHNRSGEVGFDDITFLNGECFYTATTDFENGFDVYHNIYSNDFNWVTASPSDGVFSWLPANDYSENSPQGHFAVASVNMSNPAGKKAELWSHLLTGSSYTCGRFSGFVHGKDPGMLNITLVDYMQDIRTVVWSYSPAPGSKDQELFAQFPSVYPDKFYIVFTVVLGSDGGWALDSISSEPSFSPVCRVLPAGAAASTVAPPTQPPPPTTPPFNHVSLGECDFEIDMCQWYIPDDIYFNWNRTNGDSTLRFAPKHGRPGGGSYYMALPKSNLSETASLQGQHFNTGSPEQSNIVTFTFRFWLYMAGEHLGQFFVLLVTQHTQEEIYYRDWATNSWEQIELIGTSSEDFYLMIQGRRGSYDLDEICVDDIEFSLSPAKDDDSAYKCTFEIDLCGFQQDTTDNMDWEWTGGYNGKIQADHTTLTEFGHEAMIDPNGKKPGDIGRLVSAPVPPMSGCMILWLLMESDGNALRIYISRNGEEELLLQRRGLQSRDWVELEAPVSSNVPFNLIIEAEIMANQSFTMAIDDFSLSGGGCSTQGACSFEMNMCTWQNSIGRGPGGDDFDWIRGSGSTVGAPGPAVDNTLGTPVGYFVYVDSSGPYLYQQRAWLDSETFPKGIQCLHFHYNMRGTNVGMLNVILFVVGYEVETLLWSLSGDQGSDWKTAMLTVGSNQMNYFVRFEAVLGYSVTSNIAIDDVNFLPDSCNVQPPKAKVVTSQITTTLPGTGSTVTTTPYSPPTLHSCNFDDVSICGFKNDKSGQTNNVWALSNSNMITSGTLHPFNGHTSSSINMFIYPQVLHGLRENATARFISPSYFAGSGEPKCLQFFYHMNGNQLGWVNVYIVPDGQENNVSSGYKVWSQNFDVGPGWKMAQVPLNQPRSFHIIFESIRSKFDYYYGIDDMTIFDGACEPAGACDFEFDLCLWSNDGGETLAGTQFYWKRYRGQARTAEFASAIDHTRQTVSGYYLLVESSLYDTGSVARLYSQVFKASNSPYCFRFWYYMFGNNVGNLRVFVRNSISSTNVYSDALLWEMDGSAGAGLAGDKWYLGQVNISRAYTQNTFMVIIEASVGTTFDGAFGIDDTQFEMSECGTQPSAASVTSDPMLSVNCNFENGDTCNWAPLTDEWFRFRVAAGSPDSIPADHDGGGGLFLLADSNQILPGFTSIMQSPLLPPTFGTNCLTFWYNMQQTGLSVVSLEMIAKGSNILLWEAYPEKSGEWNPVSINIQNSYDYELLIVVTMGTKDEGSVGFDDINMVHGACYRSAMLDFENGWDGFTPVVGYNFEWMLKTANATFVQLDHTYHTTTGHIMQADFSLSEDPQKTATIKSPLYPPAGDECVEMWYAKKGSTGGSLSCHIIQSRPGFTYEDYTPIWLVSEDTHGNWTRGLVDISSDYPYWIIIQATGNSSTVKDIINIDDISFKTRACPSVISCDFDINTCEYTSTHNGSVYWQLVKGAYSDALMPVDQTLQTNQGMYMEVAFSGNIATLDLISPVEKQTTPKCLIFWYYGQGAGLLQVFAQSISSQRQYLLSVQILANMSVVESFRAWKKMQSDVSGSQPYSIVFEVSNQDIWAMIAIDSIQLLNGSCASQSNTQNTQVSTNNLLDPKKAMLGCDFEASNLCNFTVTTSSGSSKNLAWKIFTLGSKHSPGTGVDFDHTLLNKYGHHAYMDTYGQKFNSSVQLTSPEYIDMSSCLSFYYAMYGRDVNRLNVYMDRDHTTTLLWTRAENQGQDWHHQLVDLPDNIFGAPTKIVIEGVVGRSSESDIDLDDIWIFNGDCPPLDFCDFEDRLTCQMDQDNMDDSDWLVQAGSDAKGTDPKVDHSLGTDKGNYLIMDMTKTKNSDDAIIFTRQYNPASARCLSFWFHLSNPPNVSHVLTIDHQDERGIRTTVMVLKGFFKDDWTLALAPLQPTENIQIVFDGQSSGPVGSIALDDIQVSPNQCDNYMDCTFESDGMCGWEPVLEFSQPPWQMEPPNHYLALNLSGLTDNIYVSKIESPLGLPNTGMPFCFAFDYLMYGDNIGWLNVTLEVEYPTPMSVLMFSTYGDHFRDTWRLAEQDSPGFDIGVARFVITGSTASKNSTGPGEAIIHISGLKMIPEPCESWNDANHDLYSCNHGYQIASTEVCDFVVDCPYGDDELNCGTCDFEQTACNWNDDSTGSFMFVSVIGIPNLVFSDSHPGNFLTVQRKNDDTTGVADIVLTQELGPSPYNCTMLFSYYMSLDSQTTYGNLYVSIEENYEETVVWESSQTFSPNWHNASVDIGSIHSRFKLHFSVKYLPFVNSIGVDEITFSGCHFAGLDEFNGTCGAQFRCQSTGACVDRATKVCDFTDECGDESDEDPSVCATYLMDNFEESLGDWSQDTQDDFDWSRHSGSWTSPSSGPRRDHTVGTHFGHYLIFEGSSYTDGQVARLFSPVFLPTQDNGCKIRFYYHMHGSDQGQLTVYILSQTSGKLLQIGQYFTRLSDRWLFGLGNLTSKEEFRVVFEGRVIGQHSTDTGLDDITFTPQCQQSNNSSYLPKIITPTPAPTTTSTTRLTTLRTTPVVRTSTARLTQQTQTSATTRSSPTNPTPSTPRTAARTSRAAITTRVSSRTAITTRVSSGTGSPGRTSRVTWSRTSTVRSNTATTQQRPVTGRSAATTRTSSLKSGATRPPFLPTRAALPDQSSGSDSWKIPVGVVLGLVALLAVVVGTFIYLKRTRRLNWLTFPLLRARFRHNDDDTRPVFQYETPGETPMNPIAGQESGEVTISANISEEEEEPIPSTVNISNPMYEDTT